MDNMEELDHETKMLGDIIRSLQRLSQEYVLEEEHKIYDTVRKAIEEGNVQGARIYAGNMISKWEKKAQIDNLTRRLNGVATSVVFPEVRARVSGSLGKVVKSLESSLQARDFGNMIQTVREFENSIPDSKILMAGSSEKKRILMAGSSDRKRILMAGSSDNSRARRNSISIGEMTVDSLIGRVMDVHSYSLPLPQLAALSIASKSNENIDDTGMADVDAKLVDGDTDKVEKHEAPK